VFGVAIAGAVWLSLSANDTASERRISRFTIDLPAGQVIPPGFNSHLAISPDGTHLAFTPLPGPLYIRRLDSLENQPLEVTKSPGFRGGPMFSPDGSSISYVEGNAIVSWSRLSLEHYWPVAQQYGQHRGGNITGIRPHHDDNDHTAPFNAVFGVLNVVSF
jgi:hypothetical protein